MPAISLPDQPNLEHLRGQARALQRAAQAGDAAAMARIAAHHRGPLTLSAAQLVVAREYGFASWPRLRRHLEVVTEYRRDPDADGEPDVEAVDRFCRLACLNYGNDNPGRWAQARALLAAQPDLAGRTIWAAAVASDPAAVTALLAADPGLANRDGGPYRWAPLAYLTYSRLDPAVPAERVLTVARILLRAGADPNTGYLWHGLPTPFTVLTGALGEGEGGPDNQPRHPHWVALATVLLESGADPNDGQGLYNRMFVPGTEHLELLFAHGLGTGDGGPWRSRLGEAAQTPAEMLRYQLDWAISRHHADRVGLLAGRGVDLSTPLRDGYRPAELAALAGDPAVVAILLAHGAPAPDLPPEVALVAAALAADRVAAQALVAEDPGLPARARELRPTAVVAAADAGRVGAVELLVELGFDVNAGARPGEGWQVGATALHLAAHAGNVELVTALLACGADPARRDAAFDATPAGWAVHAGRPEVAALL